MATKKAMPDEIGAVAVPLGAAADLDSPEPRWPALVAFLAVAGLYTALPAPLAVGPNWLLPAIVCLLLVPTVLTHHRGQHHLNRILGHLISATVTAFMIWSIVLLVTALPRHKETPVALLRSAGALWVTNVLVFASWYWRLDAGGPHARDQRPEHSSGAFLFPQMVLDPNVTEEPTGDAWSPTFIDYLFLAFNTSTALSPTDTPVLSRWAKALMMTQASISLTVMLILAARAVNIL